ncbi:unnamed protein product, partial [Soboliphyme baturini]|uniref:DH domain-containing protein n=1 Tax=Soboliphyme baturini TaxID=241478 RepID=A0A183ILB9_9BILA
RPPKTGWAPGSLFETPSEYYRLKRRTREISPADVTMSRQDEAISKRNDDPGRVGQTFGRLERDFDYHAKYAHDEPEVEKLLQKPEIKIYLEKAILTDKSGKSLEDYLRLPIKQITEYQKYLKEMIKYTSRTDVPTESLEKALELMLSVPKGASDIAYVKNILNYPGDVVKIGRLLRHDEFRLWEGTQEGDGELVYAFLFKSRLVITTKQEAEDVDELPEFVHKLSIRVSTLLQTMKQIGPFADCLKKSN